jgi:hypothetical protein
MRGRWNALRFTASGFTVLTKVFKQAIRLNLQEDTCGIPNVRNHCDGFQRS